MGGGIVTTVVRAGVEAGYLTLRALGRSVSNLLGEVTIVHDECGDAQTAAVDWSTAPGN